MTSAVAVSLSAVMSWLWPVTGSETNITSPARLDMTWLLKPVVLCFPDHRPGVLRHDQHGARKPSTRTDWPRTAALASSAGGRPAGVGCSVSGVISVIMRERGCVDA